ncbi:hypothetical protein J437_LFUL011913 [Ladona fulva]|uniref:Solute carrier family 25 member 40 n=1 Tax=Ladona fulva TaxID=123851 RepID=A0A8K0NUZ2_LADFU|nr:hypothetical protein J437_LFUL011913 [Ladona fulva]
MSALDDQEIFGYDDPRFRITPLQQMGAACTGAIVASLMMTPLDVVKIRLQAQEKALLSNKSLITNNGVIEHLCPCFSGNPTGPTNFQHGWFKEPGHFNGTVDAFVKISRHEGVSSLWSGLSPTLLLALPATVIYYVAYEQLRVRLKDFYNTNWNQGKPQTQPSWIPLVSGATARIWAATIVSPLELIRTKMQSKKLSYPETLQAIKQLIRNQGISGLWKGLAPTLMRDVPFSAIYWIHYEGIKNAFSQQSPSFGFSFFAGAVSGSIAGILTLPFDVVKTHLQIEIGEKESQQTRGGRRCFRRGSGLQYEDLEKQNKRASTADIMRLIYSETGYKGLFTGFVPRVVKVAPACAIMVASFEYGKSFFEKYNKQVFHKSIQESKWSCIKSSNKFVRSQEMRL